MTNKYSILVVDDEPTNIILLETLLKREGFEVLSANSGEACIRVAREKTPDLILLDVMMPEMSGFDACRLMKKDEGLKEVPVIFITALDDRASIIEAYRAGGVDYVVKPVQLDELREKVRSVLQLQNLLRDKNDLLRVNHETLQVVKHVLVNLTLVKRLDVIKEEVKQQRMTAYECIEAVIEKIEPQSNDEINELLNMAMDSLDVAEKAGEELFEFGEIIDKISKVMEGMMGGDGSDAEVSSIAKPLLVSKTDRARVERLILELSSHMDQ